MTEQEKYEYEWAYQRLYCIKRELELEAHVMSRRSYDKLIKEQRQLVSRRKELAEKNASEITKEIKQVAQQVNAKIYYNKLQTRLLNEDSE